MLNPKTLRASKTDRNALLHTRSKVLCDEDLTDPFHLMIFAYGLPLVSIDFSQLFAARTAGPFLPGTTGQQICYFCQLQPTLRRRSNTQKSRIIAYVSSQIEQETL